MQIIWPWPCESSLPALSWFQTSSHFLAQICPHLSSIYIRICIHVDSPWGRRQICLSPTSRCDKYLIVKPAQWEPRRRMWNYLSISIFEKKKVKLWWVSETVNSITLDLVGRSSSIFEETTKQVWPHPVVLLAFYTSFRYVHNLIRGTLLWPKGGWKSTSLAFIDDRIF